MPNCNADTLVKRHMKDNDIRKVARAGAKSVVLGRSLLEGKFTVEEAIKCWQNA